MFISRQRLLTNFQKKMSKSGIITGEINAAIMQNPFDIRQKRL